jgi:hypothetical protein
MAADVKSAAPKGYSERAVYVAKGSIEVDGQELKAGQMAVVDRGADAVITSHEPSTVMLLGGDPVGPRHIWWNYVSSSRERIEEAKEAWKSGRMSLPRGDDQEFIPLPEDSTQPVLERPASDAPCAEDTEPAPDPTAKVEAGS